MSAPAWKPDEDRRLTAARDLGMEWKIVAKHYCPGRTAHACSARYEYLKRNEREDKRVVMRADTYHNSAAKLGSDALLARQIKTGQVFPITMTIWQARHGVPA